MRGRASAVAIAAIAAIVVVVGGLFAAGCSNDGGDEATTTTTTSTRSRDPLVVATDLGKVRGTESAVAGVRAFLAMPYAAAPVGDDRWRPPQPRAPYDGTFDASKPGPSCPQPAQALSLYTIPAASEDCLTVSVWSPDDARRLPVLVWFHGGAMREGSAEQQLYVGDDLAANGAVVVGVNYRLGVFGFLATEGLAKERGDGSVGNDGLADQRAALRWVRRNIAAFGGDPRRVTIFGESSGGASVCAHLASRASTGLFARAIVQSPSLGEGSEAVSETASVRPRLSDCNRFQPRDVALARGASFLSAAGCPDIACLRALPTEKILATGFWPAVVADGADLSATAQQVAARRRLDSIPVMVGSNGTEETLFTLGAAEPSDAELRALFAQVTDRPDQLLALYPAAGYASNLERFRTMITDARFGCSVLSFAEASTGRVFLYQYEYDSPADPFHVGPTHGAELIPLFAHPEGIKGLGPMTEQPLLDLSAAMQRAWVAFAGSGDPGAGWEPFRTAHRATILASPVTSSDQIRGGRCDAVRELTGGAL